MNEAQNECIAQIEESKEGSPQLDSLIWFLIGGNKSETPPPFTTSIDAARKCVPRPKGSMSLATTFSVGGFQDSRPHGGWAKVYHDCVMAGGPYEKPPYEGKAASPALALCIAGLKAFFDDGGEFELAQEEPEE